MSPPASLTSSDDEHRTEAWLSAAAFPLEEGAEDDGEDNNDDARGPVLEDDLRAARAHAVARRAEDATARLEADERAARLATAAAVARLLDARMALAAAAGARGERGGGDVGGALCAAEAASARLTLDDEVGPSGDRGVGTCEALAEALSAPLPNVGGGKRQP